ncbi:hypothetical protein CF326_g4727 [Tilletia indica]|nr:hypothetical protein CF326_g4727 [Tilletia indica]
MSQRQFIRKHSSNARLPPPASPPNVPIPRTPSPIRALLRYRDRCRGTSRLGESTQDHVGYIQSDDQFQETRQNEVRADERHPYSCRGTPSTGRDDSPHGSPSASQESSVFDSLVDQMPEPPPKKTVDTRASQYWRPTGEIEALLGMIDSFQPLEALRLPVDHSLGPDIKRLPSIKVQSATGEGGQMPRYTRIFGPTSVTSMDSSIDGRDSSSNFVKTPTTPDFPSDIGAIPLHRPPNVHLYQKMLPVVPFIAAEAETTDKSVPEKQTRKTRSTSLLSSSLNRGSTLRPGGRARAATRCSTSEKRPVLRSIPSGQTKYEDSFENQTPRKRGYTEVDTPGFEILQGAPLLRSKVVSNPSPVQARIAPPAADMTTPSRRFKLPVTEINRAMESNADESSVEILQETANLVNHQALHRTPGTRFSSLSDEGHGNQQPRHGETSQTFRRNSDLLRVDPLQLLREDLKTPPPFPSSSASLRGTSQIGSRPPWLTNSSSHQSMTSLSGTDTKEYLTSCGPHPRPRSIRSLISFPRATPRTSDVEQDDLNNSHKTGTGSKIIRKVWSFGQLSSLCLPISITQVAEEGGAGGEKYSTTKIMRHADPTMPCPSTSTQGDRLPSLYSKASKFIRRSTHSFQQSQSSAPAPPPPSTKPQCRTLPTADSTMPPFRSVQPDCTTNGRAAAGVGGTPNSISKGKRRLTDSRFSFSSYASAA